jgi:hypothetical protein
MTPLLAYFWPGAAAGLVLGAATLTYVYRRKLVDRPKWTAITSGIGLTWIGTALWSGPLGGAERFIRSVERMAREALDHYEMSQIKASLGRSPLTRELLLSGKADDFQRSELSRLFSQLPGVSDAGFVGHAGVPLVLEAFAVSLAGFLVGAFLAYLLEAHRRYNAQWNW